MAGSRVDRSRSSAVSLQQHLTFSYQADVALEAFSHHVEVSPGALTFATHLLPKFGSNLPQFHSRGEGGDRLLQLRLRGEGWQNLLNAREAHVDVSDNLFQGLRFHRCDSFRIFCARSGTLTPKAAILPSSAATLVPYGEARPTVRRPS